MPFSQTRLWQGAREPPAVPYLQTQSQFADFNMQIQPQILALPDAHLQSAEMCKKGHRRPVHVPNYAKQQGNRTQAIAAGRRGARYNSAGKNSA